MGIDPENFDLIEVKSRLDRYIGMTYNVGMPNFEHKHVITDWKPGVPTRIVTNDDLFNIGVRLMEVALKEYKLEDRVLSGISIYINKDLLGLFFTYIFSYEQDK